MYKFIVGILILVLIILNNTGSSYSLFSDNSGVEGNYMTVGDLNNLVPNKITPEPPVSYVNAPNSY